MKTSIFQVCVVAAFSGLVLESCSNRVYDNYASTYTSGCNPSVELCAAAESPQYTWARLTAPGCDYSIITDGIVASVLRGREASYPVSIEEAIEAPGMYRIVNPIMAYVVNDEQALRYLIIDATDPHRVFVKKQDIGSVPAYGEMAVESFASYYADEGNPAILLEDAGYYGSLSNGEITFPASAGFILWTESGRIDTNLDGKFRIILPERVAAVESSIPKEDYNLGILTQDTYASRR